MEFLIPGTLSVGRNKLCTWIALRKFCGSQTKLDNYCNNSPHFCGKCGEKCGEIFHKRVEVIVIMFFLPKTDYGFSPHFSPHFPQRCGEFVSKIHTNTCIKMVCPYV